MTATSPDLDHDVLRGRQAVLARFEDLAARHHHLAPTASGAWLRAALDAAPATSVWAVVMPGAAVVLHDRIGDQGRRSELLTGGGGHLAGVAASSPAAAWWLGAALAREADARGSGLHLTELPDDPAVAALADGAGAVVTRGVPVPYVLRPLPGEQLVSAGVRKNLRKTHNRLATDGVAMDISITADAATFEAALPDLETAYRDRDEAHGVACALDTPWGRRTWLGRLRALADLPTQACRRELGVLRLDGEVAAYVVGLRQGERYGIYDGRFRTRWARYSPGRLLEHAVLRHAFDQPGVQLVDWMTGVAPETLLCVSGYADRLAVDRPAAGGPQAAEARPAMNEAHNRA
ncbi:GNAT family N-acetyltransferase [Kineococcus sp. SYSU DK003]|uniref:GNAT family N-acetyltransferase n=1 Tax=Kineococcus sp. SYSU DK003 TaxID=3383124 RepID=UPI003D7C4462